MLSIVLATCGCIDNCLPGSLFPCLIKLLYTLCIVNQFLIAKNESALYNVDCQAREVCSVPLSAMIGQCSYIIIIIGYNYIHFSEF